MFFKESHYLLFNTQFISIVHSYRETGLLARLMVFMLEENRNNENRYISMKSCTFN